MPFATTGRDDAREPVGGVRDDGRVRRLLRETAAIFKPWWLLVAGMGLGIVAIVQAVRGSHASAWFWAFCAMAALAAALAWRLRQTSTERGAALADGEGEGLAAWLERRIDELRGLQKRLCRCSGCATVRARQGPSH